jgi:cytosine/adenosine deaminase-related metal-dependent hydrolase
MDSRATVIPQGTVWIQEGEIARITAESDSPPEGFTEVTPVDSGGTLFPGLIELHNHLAYDILPLWHVPQRYTNRDVWGNSAEYHKLVTAPMETIGAATGLLPALVRYVEVKALVGGVTTTQGVPLFSAPGLVRYYRGIVRNVEHTGDPSLPAAGARIADVAAADAQTFLAELHRRQCFLLHLSEGTDEAAHRHFESLKLPSGEWAIAPSLAGIHCVALQAADFQTLAAGGASMIWSPFSNLLLYGQTADMTAARAAASGGAALKIGLGSDWSPTGSRSLLGELKVARLYSDNSPGGFNDEQVVALATINGAHILGWQDELGSIEVGKRADLMVIDGQSDTPYADLFAGDERRVQLVVINGTPRYGTTALMAADGQGVEQVEVGGQPRVLYLAQPQEDPDVAAISYAQARSTLTDALHNIKEIRLKQEAKEAKEAKGGDRLSGGLQEGGPVRLALDEFEHTDFTQRPHLPLDGMATGPRDRPQAAAAPISSLLEPMTLDALTVADDPPFLDRVAQEANLPPWLAPGLKQLYEGRNTRRG